jgi:tRNA pseudouridine synthase A
VKIRLTYAYNGANFSGSQTQPNGKSVEDALNLALARHGIFERVISSGRTDRGVHALGQISTTHCGDFWDLQNLKKRLNFHLRPYIFIKKIECVSEDFQPRFDAKSRVYAYVLNHANFSPFMADFCHFCEHVDVNVINEILRVFVGKHDFTGFMKSDSDEKSPVREIFHAYAFSHKDYTIIKFCANGFLRSQVRLMVANALFALRKIEKMDLKFDSDLSKFDKNLDTGFNMDLAQICREILRIDTPLTRIPAPPNGLYLQRVFY